MKPRSSRFALLGLLALRPMSGYEIRKTIERSISNFWNESFGQIYPTLADLVAEGLVREVPSKSRSRLFEPTEKGKKELERWLAEPIELSVSRNVFLLKLFLARFAGPEATRRHFDEFDFGYVLTVHKAQGSQWDDVVLFDESFAFPDSRDRWLYTGVTRAAKRLTVVVP